MAGWLMSKIANGGYSTIFAGLVGFTSQSPTAAIEVLGGAAKLISDLADDLGLDAPLDEIASEEALDRLVYLIEPQMAEKIEYGLMDKSYAAKKSGVKAQMFIFALTANYFNLIPRLRNYRASAKPRRDVIFGLIGAGASSLEAVRKLPADATFEEKGEAALAAMSDRIGLLEKLGDTR